MVSLLHVRQYPAGRELRPSDQSLQNHPPVSDVGQSSSTVNDLESRDTEGSAPASPLQLGNVFFPPSLVGPNPALADLPGSSSTSSLPPSGTATLSTNTLHPTPTALLSQGQTSSPGLSTKNKLIIGGAAGGGGLVLIFLALLLFCRHKRRSKRDLEHTNDGHPEGHTGHGQFTSCNHGACNTQTPMGYETPFRPFVLKIDPAPLTPKEEQQQHTVMVSLNRRDSTGSQKSAGSDTCSGESACSTGGSARRRKGEHKRPPPLKLTSLVTPVLHGPQHNPRDRNSSPGPPELPRIVVDAPLSATPVRTKHY